MVLKEVKGTDAGLNGDDQILIALKRIIQYGGVAQMNDIYNAVNDVLRPRQMKLSDQGEASLRFFVNTEAVGKGFVFAHDKENPGWRITPQGRQHIESVQRENNLSESDPSAPAAPRASTYLLAWNSTRWQWDELPEAATKVARGQQVLDRWSCGQTKRIREGDRVFLIRLGLEPRGIFASGTVTRGSYEAPHWDDEKARQGITTNHVEIRFDVLLNPETDHILRRDRLKNYPQFSRMHWDTQRSGISIPDDIADELEAVWADMTGATWLPEEVEDSETYPEGSRRQITVNAYERNPNARRRCIERYGAACVVCGFDFDVVYGEVARGYIHVHHLKPLSEVDEDYEVDPVADLRPVCPNCHAMIHRRKKAYSVEEVKEFFTNS